MTNPSQTRKFALPARCREDEVHALHEDVERQRIARGAFVIQGGYGDGVVVDVAGLVKGVGNGEGGAGADAQINLLHRAVAPIDLDAVTFERLVGDFAAQSDLLKGKALDDRCVDGRHAVGDVEHLGICVVIFAVQDRKPEVSSLGEEVGRDDRLKLVGVRRSRARRARRPMAS